MQEVGVPAFKQTQMLLVDTPGRTLPDIAMKPPRWGQYGKKSEPPAPKRMGKKLLGPWRV